LNEILKANWRAFYRPLLLLKLLCLCCNNHLDLFIFQVHDHLNKIKLSKADLSCFKNKKKCWSLNDTPTLSEDLFPTGNGEAFDIVRNSDFMVSEIQILKVNYLSAKIKI
jgi:hypothetical protein